MMLNTFKLGAKHPVYTGQVKAKIDAASEDKKILCPAYATDVELTDEKEGFQRYFKDGAWHYIVDNTGTEYWSENGAKHTINELGEDVPEGALLEAPPEPEPTEEELKTKAIAQREAAYRSESDPLFLEAMRKDAAGDIEGATVAREAGLAAVISIHARFPISEIV
jgi:hypothetical protein